MDGYILGIDQSTQGTKALLFNKEGKLIARADTAHRQIVNEKGWIEHDLEEIYSNTIQSVKKVVEKAGIDKSLIKAAGISNQRETTVAFDLNGKPICNAIVWQCARAADICEEISAEVDADSIEKTTGIKLSPYFPAAKLSWILQNVDGAAEMARNGELRCGTVDTFLVYRLTHNAQYRTDFSNASRTQLFNIRNLEWDSEMCSIFGIPMDILPEVTDSDALFGETDFEGYLDAPIPIHSVMGDSHCALFGQGCLEKGMTKATYGTGSSVMMNIGEKPVSSTHGLITSLAWKMNGQTQYVLEGNINYAGAVISWLKDDIHLIESAAQTQQLSEMASDNDNTYLIPAFSGLGAPYWKSDAKALMCGMSRTTGKNEIVRAAVNSIAYQITDIVFAMNADLGANASISELRTDGGPTSNRYLMQFQSDISGVPVSVSPVEELSGMGAAYAAGISIGMYNADTLFRNVKREKYMRKMTETEAMDKYKGWLEAVHMTIVSD